MHAHERSKKRCGDVWQIKGEAPSEPHGGKDGLAGVQGTCRCERLQRVMPGSNVDLQLAVVAEEHDAWAAQRPVQARPAVHLGDGFGVLAKAVHVRARGRLEARHLPFVRQGAQDARSQQRDGEKRDKVVRSVPSATRHLVQSVLGLSSASFGG